MGLIDLFKSKIQQSKKSFELNIQEANQSEKDVRNSPEYYVDSSTVSPDERPFYQPDNYYTFYSYPGTAMAKRVVPFDERKQTTYPSQRGLYVAEILLLAYCDKGKYPKPKGGYPGFWWFKYGIRDVGHALESLEQRGFIQWTSKSSVIENLKVDELKEILANAGLSDAGRKSALVARIVANMSNQQVVIPNYVSKYELTALGKEELEQNGYVLYMHRHRNATIEGNQFGKPFNVWEINKLFSDGDATNWKSVVGAIEKQEFGVDMANADTEPKTTIHNQKADCFEKRNDIRKYLASQQSVIQQGVQKSGDGFDEASKGYSYKSVNQDKEALVQFYIAIGKRLDTPALYRETAILLRRYGMYEEELAVLDAGLKNVPEHNAAHWAKLQERKQRVQELIEKQERTR